MMGFFSIANSNDPDNENNRTINLHYEIKTFILSFVLPGYCVQ